MDEHSCPPALSPPHTPSQDLESPYDLSYPSPATWTSSLPRGILRHRPHAPPNTPEVIDLSSPQSSPTKSVRFDDAAGRDFDARGMRGVEYRDPKYQPNWMTSDDSPIPQPQYNAVRPWLKGLMRTTFSRHHSAPNLPSNPHPQETPSSSFLLHFHNLSFDSNRPPPMSPTETSNSDPLNDTSRITWSQMEMEVEDPDWSFEPIMSGQDALEALCAYGSDEVETDLILSPRTPALPTLASPFASPTQPTQAKDLYPQPESPDDHGVGLSSPPKLPLKFSSPLPSQYVRTDPGSESRVKVRNRRLMILIGPSPFKPFYSWSN